MTTTLARRRTGGDILVGALLIVAAMVMFGDVVVATVVSVLLLGWTALVSGIVMVARTLVDIRSGASGTVALGGVALVVLGLFYIRNPGIGALTLTLLASLEPDTTTPVLVWEDSWAVAFGDAVSRAGGALVAHDRVPRQDVERALAGWATKEEVRT